MKPLIFILLFILILACGGSDATAIPQADTDSTSTPLPTPIPITPIPSTPEPLTSEPTPLTSEPTPPTPEPPTPTPTPEPPPPTSEPPTTTPAPLTYTGSGDTIQDIAKWPGPALIRVVGNAGGRFFAIVPYDAAGGRLSSVVSVTEPYNGLVGLDLDGDQTTRLEIQAEGDWTIDILPLSAARVLAVPGRIEGQGDEVIQLSGPPDMVTVTGNEAANHFAIVPYTQAGRRFGSIINTTDAYQGTVIVDRQAEMLEILATGGWVIEVTGP